MAHIFEKALSRLNAPQHRSVICWCTQEGDLQHFTTDSIEHFMMHAVYERF